MLFFTNIKQLDYLYFLIFKQVVCGTEFENSQQKTRL